MCFYLPIIYNGEKWFHWKIDPDAPDAIIRKLRRFLMWKATMRGTITELTSEPITLNRQKKAR